MKKKIVTGILLVATLSLLIGTGIVAEDNTIKSKGRIEVGEDILIDSEDIINLDTRVSNINSFIGSSDISNIGDGTLTGAISSLNNNLTNSNGEQFRFAYDEESDEYGYIREIGGADTFFPFRSELEPPQVYGGSDVNYTPAFSFTLGKGTYRLTHIWTGGVNGESMTTVSGNSQNLVYSGNITFEYFDNYTLVKVLGDSATFTHPRAGTYGNAQVTSYTLVQPVD